MLSLFHSTHKVFSVFYVFITSRCLVTDSNNVLFFRTHVLTDGSLTTYSFKVSVTLRLAVYRQSVRLGVKPLETQDQSFFSN
jgi:hypothetical protein